MIFDDTAQLIAYIESGNNQYAIRFEPRIYKFMSRVQSVIDRICNENRCDIDTAAVIYSSSFGLYQIMGFNLYGSLLCRGSVGAFMCDANYQTSLFYNFLKIKNVDYTIGELEDEKNRLNFALEYNGSSKYAETILSDMHR